MIKSPSHPDVCSCRHYCFEGEELAESCAFLRAVTEHGEMRLFDNFHKMDVVFSASEVEDLEAAARTIIKAASQLDWWTYSARSLAVLGSSEAKKLKHIFVTGTHCQLLVAKTA